MPAEMDPEALLQGFRDKLHSKWTQHRNQAFNANTKGAAYENALQDFLREYFNGIYDIHTRTAVIDDELDVFDIFTAGESELDIIATFSRSYPSIILKSDSMSWVPYPSVAFVCEVKSEISKSAFESDIEKLAKLSKLGPDNYRQRFSPNTSHIRMYTGDGSNKNNIQSAQANHQLKCFVYDEKSISGETLLTIADDYTDIWDLILLVDDDLVIVSPELPFVDGWYSRFNMEIPDGLPDVLVLPDGLVWFICILSITIPNNQPIYAGDGLMQLVQREWREEDTEYDQLLGAWDKLM